MICPPNNSQIVVTIQVHVRVKSQKSEDLELKSDTLIQIKFKIQFQNSIQDCDKVESNSSLAFSCFVILFLNDFEFHYQ